MKGWVYVFTNEAMPGLVKIGYTSKSPEKRAAELDTTGVPLPFIVEYGILVEAPRPVEQTVHLHLREKRVRQEREWFRCSKEEAVMSIKKQVSDKYEKESYRSNDLEERIAGIERENQEQEAEKERKKLETIWAGEVEEENKRLELDLEKKHQEVAAKHDRLFKETVQRMTSNPIQILQIYFLPFCGIFIFTNTILLSLSSNLSESSLLLSLLFSFPLSKSIKRAFEDKAKESDECKDILSKRKDELTKIEDEKRNSLSSIGIICPNGHKLKVLKGTEVNAHCHLCRRDREAWERFLATIQKHKLSLFFALKSAHLHNLSQTMLTIGVNREPYFKALTHEENHTLLEETASRIFGRPLRVEVSNVPPPISVNRAGGSSETQKARIADEDKDPLVRTILDMLGEEVQSTHTHPERR